MLEACIMTKSNNPKTFASFINCLSLLENNTSLLYKHLADKVEVPLVKSFLLQIATDSQKHAIILKGIGETITEPQGKSNECQKKMGEFWRIVETILREIKRKSQKFFQVNSRSWLKNNCSRKYIGRRILRFRAAQNLRFYDEGNKPAL